MIYLRNPSLSQVNRVDRLALFVALIETTNTAKRVGIDSIYFRLWILYCFASGFLKYPSPTMWVMCLFVVASIFSTAIKLSDVF